MPLIDNTWNQMRWKFNLDCEATEDKLILGTVENLVLFNN